jgi:hypothetical protein
LDKQNLKSEKDKKNMINDKIRKIMKQKMEKRHFQTPFDNN